MAVAAHVSRVAKDYSPFGYSIMETVSGWRDVAAGGTTAFYLPLYSCDDDDIYLESAFLWTKTALGSEATNYWTMSLVKGPSGLPQQTAVSGERGGASTAIAIDTLSEMAILVPQVEKELTLWLKCLPNHASSAAGSLGAIVRYRRKA